VTLEGSSCLPFAVAVAVAAIARWAPGLFFPGAAGARCAILGLRRDRRLDQSLDAWMSTEQLLVAWFMFVRGGIGPRRRRR